MPITVDISSVSDVFGNTADTTGRAVVNNVVIGSVEGVGAVQLSPAEASGAGTVTSLSGITVGASTRVIEEDVISTVTFNASSGSTWQASAGTNRCVIASVLFSTGPNEPDAVTVSIGAQAMTQIGGLGTINNGRPKTAMFYLLDADIPGTAETVSVQVTNSCRDCSVVLTELQGVNQSSPIGAEVEFSDASISTAVDETINAQFADSFILSALQLVPNADGAVVITNSTDSTPEGAATFTRIPEGDVTNTNIYAGALYYEISIAAGNITHSWTMTPGGKEATRIIEVRAA